MKKSDETSWPSWSVEWDARVQPSEIGVIVKEDVVTLTGWVDSYTKKWAAGPVDYWHVDDVYKTVEQLLGAGVKEQQAVRDVGGGKLTALVKDADGNVIGLVQSP